MITADSELVVIIMPFPSPGVLCFSELSFITEPSDITVLPKDSAVLDCLAHGQPPVTMKWLKNGVPMAASEHAQFLPNGSLYIPTVKNDRGDSDEGFYQCLSQNKYGAILSQRSRLTIASEYEPLWEGKGEKKVFDLPSGERQDVYARPTGLFVVWYSCELTLTHGSLF